MRNVLFQLHIGGSVHCKSWSEMAVAHGLQLTLYTEASSGPRARDQDVENGAVLIDGTPKPVLLAVDGDDNFVEMPFVPLSSLPTADFRGVGRAELQRPTPDGLVADDDPALGQHILDHPQPQRKPEVEPDGLRDDCRRMAVATVQWTMLRHAATLFWDTSAAKLTVERCFIPKAALTT